MTTPPKPAHPGDCPTLEDLELAIVEAVREVMRENGDLPARQSEPAETLEQVRDRLAEEQHIYEPKYGGKDHSGYDTLMKYEVNYEREEAFVAGFDAAIEYVRRGGKV